MKTCTTMRECMALERSKNKSRKEAREACRRKFGFKIKK